MLSLSTRRRAIHAIVEALTRDYISHGGKITKLQPAYCAPVQTVERVKVARIPVQREPQLWDVFSL